VTVARSRAKKKKVPVTDPIILGCLDRLKTGDVIAVGVLADHLDDVGRPEAKAVREAWDRYARAERVYLKADVKPRRRLSRWEEIALWRMWLFRRVRTIYGIPMKQMRMPKIHKFYTRPIITDEEG
jgi:hypothetical protein